MLTKRKRRILFYLSILAFLALLFPVLLYSLGYGITKDFKISKTGGIYIKSSLSGASVKVNGKVKHTSLLGYSALLKNILPGNHVVSVEKDGFWTWEKTLPVFAEAVTSRNALMIPKDLTGKILGTSSPKIKELKPIFPSVKKYWPLPNSQNFLILGEDKKFYKNKDPFDAVDAWGEAPVEILRSGKNSFFDENLNRLIFWDKNIIGSYWIGDSDKMPEWEILAAKDNLADKDKPIYSSLKEIRGVALYPDWTDYLIVAVSNGVFALELDSTGGQNIFPLYKGKMPNIVSIESGKIILKDEANYIELELP